MTNTGAKHARQLALDRQREQIHAKEPWRIPRYPDGDGHKEVIVSCLGVCIAIAILLIGALIGIYNM